MSDMSLDDIMSQRGEAVPETTTTEPAAELPATETGRDEKGRFAPKAGEAPEAVADLAAQPVVDPVEPQQPNGFVPIKALDAERGKRKEIEDRYDREIREMREQITRLSQPQQPVEPPAPPPALWDDPDAYLKHQLDPVEQRIRNMNERFSERLAVKEHGAETVTAAKTWIEQNARTAEGQRLIGELMQSDDPYDDLVQKYKGQSLLSEIGTDPEAYKQKIIQDYLATQTQAQPQQPQAQPVLPTAFAKTPTSGPRSSTEFGGARALSDIMKR